MTMTHEQWREGSFEITTRDGPVAVKGYVSDHFGIRDAGQRRPIWTVTHLATGTLVTPSTAGFRQLETAMVFADRIAALADWSRMDRDRGAPDNELGMQVMAIWNELIVLEMGSIITDCYGASTDAIATKRKTSRSRRRA